MTLIYFLKYIQAVTTILSKCYTTIKVFSIDFEVNMF